jgi:dGTPase
VAVWSEADRTRRRHSVAAEDQRHRFERDRDRILYSSAFRRLSGITQIVRAGEADVFHTRQQHTLKVAQVGRRLAQKCVAEQPDLSEFLGVHPEVVEAAALAHDLGHPPFGHVGEHVLNKLVSEHEPDGFEGNAQSFRVLTRLAVRFDECPGLDLTRATLAACIKYPWLRDRDDPSRRDKWNAYDGEQDDFAFAREHFAHTAKTAEAGLMDWADDIAYSVHDLEDFHRCGAVPWSRILNGGDQSEKLVERAVSKWFGSPPDAAGRLRDALRSLSKFLQGSFDELISEPYEGTRRQRQQLRTMTSALIGRYIRAARLQEPDAAGKSVQINAEEADEVLILKQITRDYIIDNPSLAGQQKGQERILKALFNDLFRDSNVSPPSYLPKRLRYTWDVNEGHPARFASDCIASLTEAEAVGLHARLQGLSSGSVLDPIVR